MNEEQKRVLKENLHLVDVIAEKYTGRGIPLLDLVQAGNLGLIRAVEEYDGSEGYELFPGIAKFHIRQAINEEFRDRFPEKFT